MSRIRLLARLVGAWLVAWGSPRSDAERAAQTFQQVALARLALLLDLQLQTQHAVDRIDLDLRLGASAVPWIADEPPAVEEPAALVDTQTLLLVDSTGRVEHEIAWHRASVPESYAYHDRTYTRRVVRPDGRWEFAR